MQYPVTIEREENAGKKGDVPARKIIPGKPIDYQHGDNAQQCKRKPCGQRGRAQHLETQGCEDELSPRLPFPRGVGLVIASANVKLNRSARISSSLIDAGRVFRGEMIDRNQVDAVVGERAPEAQQALRQHSRGGFILPQIRTVQSPQQKQSSKTGDESEPDCCRRYRQSPHEGSLQALNRYFRLVSLTVAVGMSA